MESFENITCIDLNKVIHHGLNKKTVIPQKYTEKFQEYYNTMRKIQHINYLVKTSLPKSWGEFLEGVHDIRYMKKNYWTISFIPRDNVYFITFKAGIMTNYEESVISHLGDDIKEFLTNKAETFCKISYQYFNALTGFKHDIKMNIVEGVNISGYKNKQFYAEIPVKSILESVSLGDEVSLEKLSKISESLTNYNMTFNMFTKNDREKFSSLFGYLFEMNQDFRNAGLYNIFVQKMAKIEPKLDIGEFEEIYPVDGNNTYTLGYLIANAQSGADDIYMKKCENNCEEECECDFYNEDDEDDDEKPRYTEWYTKTLNTHLELLRRVNIHFNEYFPNDLVDTSIVKDDYHYAIIKCIPNGLKL